MTAKNLWYHKKLYWKTEQETIMYGILLSVISICQALKWLIINRRKCSELIQLTLTWNLIYRSPINQKNLLASVPKHITWNIPNKCRTTTTGNCRGYLEHSGGKKSWKFSLTSFILELVHLFLLKSRDSDKQYES